MLKAIAIDDEPLAIRVIERYVNEIKGLSLIATCKKATEAYDLIAEHEPDLIFLDINMPELNGIDLMKTLPNPPLVIFTTAYPEHAMAGFQLDAIDYLLKPFSFEQFQKAILKAQKFLPLAPSKLTFKQDKKLYQLDWEQVLFMNAFGDYVKIVTIDKNYLTKSKLSQLEERCPADFIKIHRSYIVQLNAIEYLEGNQVKIGDVMIPVSQAFKGDLLNRLK